MNWFLFFDIMLGSIAVCNEFERLTRKEMAMTSFKERFLYGVDSSFLK